MSSGLTEGSRDRQQVTCGLCGRALGKGYYFVCHVCGSTFCYVHMPVRCDHVKNKPPLTARLTA